MEPDVLDALDTRQHAMQTLHQMRQRIYRLAMVHPDGRRFCTRDDHSLALVPGDCRALPGGYHRNRLLADGNLSAAICRLRYRVPAPGLSGRISSADCEAFGRCRLLRRNVSRRDEKKRAKKRGESCSLWKSAVRMSPLRLCSKSKKNETVAFVLKTLYDLRHCCFLCTDKSPEPSL